MVERSQGIDGTEHECEAKEAMQRMTSPGESVPIVLPQMDRIFWIQVLLSTNGCVPTFALYFVDGSVGRSAVVLCMKARLKCLISLSFIYT